METPLKKQSLRLVFLIYAIQSPSLVAEGNANDSVMNASQAAVIITRFARAQQALLSKVTSFSFQATCDFQVTAEFNQTLSPQYRDPTVKFQYMAAGNKFLYDVDEGNKLGTYASERYSFDGEHYQQLLKGPGILFIRSKAKVTDPILVNKQYLFDPFLFVPQERLQKPFTPLELKQFASLDNWDSLVTRVRNVRIIAGGDGKLLTFEIPGGIDVISKKSITFKVVCDDKLFDFPIKWSMVDDKGNTVCEYAVTGLESIVDKTTGLTFYYPKSAKMTRYVDKKLASTSTITISSIQFNLPIDDNQFVIDPSLANSIVDVDHNTRVEVPK